MKNKAPESPPVGNTPDRIAYLKDCIQRNFDNFNWYGNQKYKMLIIAAQAELSGYGIKFEPTYTPAT